jgi:hypothetical protein
MYAISLDIFTMFEQLDMPLKSDRAPKLKYVWSRKPKYIREFLKIRDKAFRRVIEKRFSEGLATDNLDSYGRLDSYDFRSDFFLIIDERTDKCVGGIRIVKNDNIMNLKIATEEKEISLSKLYPELKVKHNSYVELTRMSIDPDYLNVIDSGFYKELSMSLAAKGVNYLIYVAPKVQMRRYKDSALKTGKIVISDLKISSKKELEYLDLRLTVLKLPNRRSR